jgi:hypothetical protein
VIDIFLGFQVRINVSVIEPRVNVSVIEPSDAVKRRNGKQTDRQGAETCASRKSPPPS